MLKVVDELMNKMFKEKNPKLGENNAHEIPPMGAMDFLTDNVDEDNENE